MNKTVRGRIIIYLVGIFFMSLGVSLSIYADLGVSPVSSLAYAISLVTGFTVGTITILTHFCYIGLQILISKKIDMKDILVQLLIAFIFGFFIDSSLFLVRRLIPVPSTLPMRWFYLLISLVVVAFGLTGYTNMKFTLMPYDELTQVISNHYQLSYGRARVIGDLANVILALAIGVIFLSSWGSVGLGTIVAAVVVGRMVNVLLKINENYQFLIL